MSIRWSFDNFLSNYYTEFTWQLYIKYILFRFSIKIVLISNQLLMLLFSITKSHNFTLCVFSFSCLWTVKYQRWRTNHRENNGNHMKGSVKSRPLRKWLRSLKQNIMDRCYAMLYSHFAFPVQWAYTTTVCLIGE